MTVAVPSLARTGNVTVLGSGSSFELQVVPKARPALHNDQALLAEGGKLEDPATFVKRINKLMLELSV